MISNQPYRVSGGQLALGIALAIVVGLVAPVLTALEMTMLTPVVLLSGVFMVFLYCYAGRLPAWLFLSVQLASAAVLIGPTFMWMCMAAGSIPAVLAMRGIILRRPFFEQMKIDIAFYLAGLVVALMIAFGSLGGNMITRIMDSVRENFKLLPDVFFQYFVQALNAAVPEASLTVAKYRAQLMAMLDVLEETYKRMLPGTLLSGAALSGVLSALWGNWLMARRGMATDESYIGLARWFLPPQMTTGLLLMWVVSYIISATGYGGGESVYMAVYALASLAFFIQGLCAIDRFWFRRGASDRRRRFIVVMGLILGLALRIFNLFIFAVGAISALFGSHGAIARTRVQRDDDDNNDDNDD